jgi:hypothetical protein
MRLLLASALALCACATDLSATASPLTDPVVACSVVDPDAIAGHEATFYLCAEETLACGPSGYLVGYGAKYAERFYRQTRPWMSAEGQAWLDGTLVCLQEELRASIDASTPCAEVRAIAFDSHPGCYVDNGFCDLPFVDWLAVLATVDGTDWLSHDSQRQVIATARACLSGD